ncbi:MAG TPA: hypothetical protein VEA40_17495, partial [Ramlibacter sp.]|nr:hypothetical protein [Ramlibacter sp.]
FRPLITTAGGIAMLLTLPRQEQEQERIVAANIRELTSHGRSELSDCHAMLERSRRLGFGGNFGDIAAGATSSWCPS